MFVAICGGAAAVGSWFTASSVKTWYPRLVYRLVGEDVVPAIG
jgi:hypothetical protein